MSSFKAADILLPDLEDLSDWSVVACDQYSSDPDYWNRVYERVQSRPSTLHLILPEAWLGTEKAESHRQKIRPAMEKMLEAHFLKTCPDSYIYVERTLADGQIRQGLIGVLDLDDYDYHQPALSPIRATEATILDRIPPRALIRQDAIVEFPHILLLQNDARDLLFQRLAQAAGQMPVLYDFDLMENGGHIVGRLVSQDLKDLTDQWIEDYEAQFAGQAHPLLYAVGDGNHSLAAAKAIWKYRKDTLDEEGQRSHPSRFALAELENLHHASQKFEPIHRILKNADVQALLDSFPPVDEAAGYPIEWISGTRRGTIYLDPAVSPLPLAVLQKHLDAWLYDHEETEIDYIHGESELESLARAEGSIGFFLPTIEKDSLFRTILADGALPRKTFSMGHAQEKRFYLEGRSLIEEPRR